MKIAYILPSLDHKGPILIAQSIVNELAIEVDFDVYYFDAIEEVEFKAKTIKIDFKQKIDFQKYDIIHTHMFRPDLYVFIRSILGQCKSVKKVSTIHQFIDHDLKNQHPLVKATIAGSLWHLTFKRFDTLVALNELMYRMYKERFSNKKVVKIHNGINEMNEDLSIPQSDIERINEFKKNHVCLGTAAQLTKNKGFHQVVELLAINTKLCFIVIGDGEQFVSLNEMAKKNNTSDRVLFLGRRDNAKHYFKYFDIFMMTSEREGFPVSLLEAASFSIPAVCTDNSIFRNIFSEDEVPFFEHENINSLNEAVNKVIKNKELYSKKIFNRFKRDYTSKIMANNYLQLYKELINKCKKE
jgi:glycosyltransferase involved in cell wall biosynthesis